MLVPGLIDAHVHIASLPQMRAALESGVTTVRSAGVSHFADVGLRDLVDEGLRGRPRRRGRPAITCGPSPRPRCFSISPTWAT